MVDISNIENLVSEVVDSVKEVRQSFSAGYLESVYRNALCVELANRGLNYEVEMPLSVSYKGEQVGEFRADIVVENRLLLELKAIQNLSKVHEIQLVNYLAITGIEDGLLIISEATH